MESKSSRRQSAGGESRGSSRPAAPIESTSGVEGRSAGSAGCETAPDTEAMDTSDQLFVDERWVFSAGTAARLLRMNESRVRRLLRQAKMKARKTADQWEIPVSEIERWSRYQAIQKSEKFLTPASAARELGVSRQAVHQMLRDGRLPSRTVGFRRLIPRKAVEEALRRRRHEGLWTLRKAAHALGLSYPQVYDLVKSGSLKATKIGSYYFVPIDEVKAFKNARPAERAR